MSFFNDMERAIKDNGERGLIHLLTYYGLDLELYRSKTDDVYSRVHGRDSGEEGQFHKTFIGVVEGVDFAPSNNYYSSDSVSGLLYTEEKDIKSGDTIKLITEDRKSRRFKITEQRNIGFTTEVFSMWSLAGIGD